MAVSIGSIFLDLRASTKGMRKDVEKSISSFKGAATQLGKIVSAGVVASAGAIAYAISQAAQSIDELAKKASALGVTTESLRTLQEIAQLNGVEVDRMNKAIAKTPKLVGDAVAGVSEAKYVFAALNLEAESLVGLAPDEQFRKISEALATLPNQGEKARLLMKAFGEEGLELANVLTDVAFKTDEVRAKLDGLGVTVSRVDAAKIEIMNNAISDLKLIGEGAANQLAIQFAPVIKGIADTLQKSAGQTKGFSGAITTLVEITTYAGALVGNVFRGWELIIKAGRVAFAAMIEVYAWGYQKLVEGGQWVAEKVTASINGLIAAYNYLRMKIGKDPIEFVDQEAVHNATEAFVTMAEEAKNAATAAREDLTAELGAVFDEPLPTAKVEAWLADVRAKINEQATQIVEETQPKFEAITIEPVKPETIKLAKEDLSELAKELKKVYSPAADTLQSVQSNISDIVRGTKSWKDALVDVAATFVTTVLQSIVQVGAQWVATQLMMGAVSEATSRSSSQTATSETVAAATQANAAWIPAAIAASIATMGAAAWSGMAAYLGATAIGTAGSVLIGAVGSLGQAALQPGKARGGDVMANRIYPINERQPEFFQPDQSGEVIPLSRMNQDGMGGGANITVQQNFASGLQRSELGNMKEQIKRETLSAVADGVARGGMYRKAIRR